MPPLTVAACSVGFTLGATYTVLLSSLSTGTLMGSACTSALAALSPSEAARINLRIARWFRRCGAGGVGRKEVRAADCNRKCQARQPTSLRHGGHVDHEPVLHVALEHAFVGVVD